MYFWTYPKCIAVTVVPQILLDSHKVYITKMHAQHLKKIKLLSYDYYKNDHDDWIKSYNGSQGQYFVF